MNRECPNEKKLSRYLDQALSASGMDRVRHHLKSCLECRRKLAALSRSYDRMDQMIRNLPEIKPSPTFDAVFWRRVAQLEEKRHRPTWTERLFSAWRPLLAAGAAAAVMTTFVLFRPGYLDPSTEEIFIADHIEMLKEFELIESLELLENWEAVQAIKEQG